jgi:transposase-like protein
MDPRTLRGREEAVVDAYERGETVEEIAARNGCGVEPVQHLLALAGVEPASRPNPMEGHEAAVAAGYVSGCSEAELARRFGCTTRAVRRALAAEGVPFRPS